MRARELYTSDSNRSKLMCLMSIKETEWMDINWLDQWRKTFIYQWREYTHYKRELSTAYLLFLQATEFFHAIYQKIGSEAKQKELFKILYIISLVRPFSPTCMGTGTIYELMTVDF
jgi:hypothetical protein